MDLYYTGCARELVQIQHVDHMNECYMLLLVGVVSLIIYSSRDLLVCTSLSLFCHARNIIIGQT